MSCFSMFPGISIRVIHTRSIQSIFFRMKENSKIQATPAKAIPNDNFSFLPLFMKFTDATGFELKILQYSNTKIIIVIDHI